MSEIPVQEEFNDSQGRFINFDAYDTTQKFALPKQKHVDIRNFNPGDERLRLSMIHFDRMNMTALDAQTVGDLEASVIIFKAESWDSGATVDYQADRNNWKGLSLTLTTGTNTTTSIIRI